MITESTRKGQSNEEEYFYKRNKELIEAKRKEIEARQPMESKPAHWMKCPKCNGSLVETELGGIHVDQCDHCQGIYFDRGELEILIESQEPKGFLGAVKQLFS